MRREGDSSLVVEEAASGAVVGQGGEAKGDRGALLGCSFPANPAKSVATYPGHTTFTMMFESANGRAYYAVTPLSIALEGA